MPTVAFSSGSVSIVEGDSGSTTAYLTVQLSAPSATSVVANYTTTALQGLATPGIDYAIASQGSLTFKPGETTKLIPFTIFGDTEYEAEEDFFVQFASVSGAEVVAQGEAAGPNPWEVVIIPNDDKSSVPTVGFTSDRRIVGEGDSGSATAYLTLELSAAVAGPVVVEYTTELFPDSATPGSDYTAVARSSVTFKAGETVKQIPIGILGDTTIEANESFAAFLIGATGAEIVKPGAEGQRSNGQWVFIIDDDGATPISLVGTPFDDQITGTPRGDVIDGGAGADAMEGRLGDDTYRVDNPGDMVIESSAAGGIDTVISTVTWVLGSNQENLTLLGTAALDATGNTLANRILGNAGNNIIDGRAGADSMEGGAGNDTYYVDNAGDIVTEATFTGGIDTVVSSVGRTLGSNQENLTLTGLAAINGMGNSLANHIVGNAAANVIDGFGGADLMEGGLGNDSYFVDNAGDIVIEASATGGIDTVFSSVTRALDTNQENLTLLGVAAINGTGNNLANRIQGNAGGNLLDGGAGADSMDGGLGDDIYYVDNAGDVVIEASATGGMDTVISSVTRVLGSNQENLTLAGTGAINGTGNTLANHIQGNAANNVIDGGAGIDRMEGGFGNDTYYVDNAGDVVSELGGAGVDTIISSVTRVLGIYQENLTLSGTLAINGTGNELANRIQGNAAANVINGAAGADTMEGGLGNDTYYVDNAGDVVTESSVTGGTDTVISSITRVLGSNQENLTLSGVGAINATGNALANRIQGNAAGNLIDGGLGADSMAGGLGNDTYYVDNAGDVVTESSATGGFDTVISSVTRVLGSNQEKLTLSGLAAIDGTGNTLNNSITGNGAANRLDGGAGLDTLSGEAGNDILIGGRGADDLFGGDGSDSFVFLTVADTGLTTADLILDFTQGEDRIDLSLLDAFTNTTAVVDDFTFVGTQAFSSNAPGQVRYQVDATRGEVMLYGNTDLDGAAEFAIELVGLFDLTSADFVF